MMEWAKERLKNAEESAKFKNGNNVVYEGQELESLLVHECTHAAYSQALGSLNPSEQDEYLGELESIYSKARSNGDICNVSEYADSLPEEYFAEAFTQYVFGKEKVPDYCVEFIEKTLGIING